MSTKTEQLTEATKLLVQLLDAVEWMEGHDARFFEIQGRHHDESRWEVTLYPEVGEYGHPWITAHDNDLCCAIEKVLKKVGFET